MQVMEDQTMVALHQPDSAGFILAAAAELFIGRGFERTSLQAIATRAGVAKGLIGHYFQSKHGLLEAIVSEFYGRQHQVLRAAHDPCAPLHPRLAALLDAYFDFMTASHGYARLVQQLVAHDDRVLKLSRRHLRVLHAWLEHEAFADIPTVHPAAARQVVLTLSGAVLAYFAVGPALPGLPCHETVDAHAERRAHLHVLAKTLVRGLEEA